MFSRKLTLAVAAAALVTPGIAAAKPGNGNGNGNNKPPVVSPAPTPAPVPAPTLAGCSSTYGVVVSGAVGCAGFFDKNIFGGSDALVSQQNLALAQLGSDYTVIANNSSLPGSQFASFTKVEGLSGGNTIDFGKTLYGETIIGAHFGNIAGAAQNVSVFWLFDFGTTGATGVRLLNAQGFSNAVLYDTGSTAGAVPEPATWALLTLAFGGIGGMMRRARRQRRALAAA